MNLKLPLIFAFILAVCPAEAPGQKSREQKEFQFAEKLYRDKLYDVAISTLNKFLTEYPDSPSRSEAIRLLGNSYFNLGSYSDARRVFGRMAEEFGGTRSGEEGLFMTARANEEMGEHSAAAEAYRRFTAYYTNSERTPKAYLAAGLNYISVGDGGVAEEMLGELAKKYRASGEALDGMTALARYHVDAGLFEKAIDELVRAESHPRSKRAMAKILRLRAEAQIGLSDFEAAEETLTRLSALSKKNPDVQYGLYMYSGLELSGRRYKDAEKLSRDVSKNAGGILKARALMRQADALALMKDYGGALKRLASVERGALGDVEMLLFDYRRAYAAELAGKREKAIGIYEGILEGGWTDTLGLSAEVLGRLADLTSKTGDPRGALGYYVQYLNERPFGKLRDRFAFKAGQICLNDLAEPERALEYYAIAADSAVRSPLADDAAYGAGMSLSEAGRYTEAIKQLRSIRSQYPGSRYIKDAEELADYIESFLQRKSQIGFERLAELLGDLISEKPKDGLYLELASIYFDEIKDYGRAREHLKRLLALSPSDETRAKALHLAAKANLMLARKAKRRGDEALSTFHRQEARTYHMLLLQQFPADENASEAAFMTVVLAGSEGAYRRRAFEKYVKSNPDSKFKDRAAFAIAEIYSEEKNVAQARRWYERVMKETPRSPLAEDATFALAKMSAANGSGERVRLDLEGYLRRYPAGKESVRARYMLGSSYERGSEQAEAMREFLEIVDEHYYSVYVDSVSSRMGRVYFEGGDYERAYEAFLTAGENASFFERAFIPWWTPGVGEDLYYAAASADRTGRKEIAAVYYRRYLRPRAVKSNSLNAVVALVRIYSEVGRKDKSKQALTAALKKKWQPGEGYILHGMLAELYFDEGDYPLARSEYGRAVRLAPAGADVTRYVSMTAACYFREGKKKDAERSVNAFLSEYTSAATEEQKAMLVYERGVYMSVMGDMKGAEKEFSKAASDYRGTSYSRRAELELGRIEAARDRGDDALSRLTRLIEANPEDEVVPEALMTMGGIYYERQQYQKAIESYKKAIESEKGGKTEPEAMQNLLKSYEEVGLLEPALAAAKEFIKRYPDSENAFMTRIKIGNYYMNMGDYENALKHFEEILPLADNESSAEIQFWIGEAYFNSELYERAISEYLKVSYLGAATKLDWSASAWWKAGNAYEQMEQYDKAVTMYQRIIREKGAYSDFGKYAQQRIDNLRLSGKIPGDG